MTAFDTIDGFNAVAIPSADNLFFGLLVGHEGVSFSFSTNTFFANNNGLSSLSLSISTIACLRVVNEDGNPFSGTITATISDGNDSYDLVFDSPEQAILNLFIDNSGNPVSQSITITDGTLTREYALTPIIGDIIVLALTRVPIDPISIVDAIGNIDSILQVQNAVLTDSTGWDGDSPKNISFPVSGGISDEPAFFFAREASHLRLTADITYEVVPGRPITETFTNIKIAP